MSRSVHKTVKGVFGGKSSSEIETMIAEDDPDVVELLRKRSYKNDERARRAAEKQPPPPDEATPTGSEDE